MSALDPEALLAFWFETPGSDRSAVWFGSDRSFDHACRARFGDALQALGRGDLNHWLDSTRGTLAFVVLADQIARNVNRGSADAFAHDPVARVVAKHAIRDGRDAELEPFERAFLYLPLQHSEALEDQDTSVTLFRNLAAVFPEHLRERALAFVDFAEQHRDIIVRFGRFPHRNAALGRLSTEDELAYLESDGARFGQ